MTKLFFKIITVSICLSMLAACSKSADNNSHSKSADAVAIEVATGSEAGLTDAAELDKLKAQALAANPGLEIVNLETSILPNIEWTPPPANENAKIAIFVKNQTSTKGMNDEVDGIRDRIGAELAGMGLIVLDDSEIIEGFQSHKITTKEKRASMVDEVFAGGSTLRIAQMLGCDYIMIVKIVGATHIKRIVDGKEMTVYNLRMSVKVNEAVQGSSVYGANWSQKMPVPEKYAGSENALSYYNDLIDRWNRKTAADIASKKASWRVTTADSKMVAFSVSTTIDELIDGLENGVRAPNELLDEMQRRIGGVTVELDGIAVGSSPGTFKTSPGIHELTITRQWMEPWKRKVSIKEGSEFRVGLELSDNGIRKFKSIEGFKSVIAINYAEAMMRKNIKINWDTENWRAVGRLFY